MLGSKRKGGQDKEVSTNLSRKLAQAEHARADALVHGLDTGQLLVTPTGEGQCAVAVKGSSLDSEGAGYLATPDRDGWAACAPPRHALRARSQTRIYIAVRAWRIARRASSAQRASC